MSEYQKGVPAEEGAAPYPEISEIERLIELLAEKEAPSHLKTYPLSRSVIGAIADMLYVLKLTPEQSELAAALRGLSQELTSQAFGTAGLNESLATRKDVFYEIRKFYRRQAES